MRLTPMNIIKRRTKEEMAIMAVHQRGLKPCCEREKRIQTIMQAKTRTHKCLILVQKAMTGNLKR